MRTSHLLALAATVLTAIAQPAPRLNSISREWIQRDTTAELTLNGENLNGAKRIVVTGAPGIKAEIIEPPSTRIAVESTGQGITTVAPVQSKSLKVRLESTPSAALVDRELRVVTGHGVSNPIVFRLSSLPELRAARNQSKETAQVIALPAVISGTISGAAQSHFYKFNAKKGEKIILNVDASRIGSRLDSSLAIQDNSGKELARSEDAVGLDSVIEFEAPQDGDFIAELRDFSYQGGGDFKYRLTMGALPFVQSIFPFGGQRGRTIEVRLRGANLGDTRSILLNLAADADPGRQEIRASTALGLSNPFTFDVTDLPSFSEAEPNTALDQADIVALPVAIDGHINKPGDYDAFRFHAGKDQRVVFDIQAYRHGSPLDAVLILTDARGNVLQRNDDSAGADARIDYSFKEPGEYHILVEDLLSRGGEEFAYRLSASIPRPDFALTILQDTPRLRRGGRVPLRFEVNRMNGFNEPVRVFCDKLPAGVFADPVTVGPETASGFLILDATADASLDAGSLIVKGAAAGREKTASALSGDKPARSAFLAVLDEAPFSIAPATLMANIEQSQSGAIQVLVNRRPGFTQDIQITPEGFSTGREPITRSFEFQPLTIKGSDVRGTLSLKAKTDSEIAIGQVVLRGEAEMNGNAVNAFSPLIPIGTVQIPFVLSTSLKRLLVTALPTSSGSAASEAVFTVKAERRAGFTGEIELTMDGLPEGVNLTLPKIAANANEATVKLVATEKTPIGKDVSLAIRGAGTHHDRTYRFAAPPVTLTINAPETDEKKAPKLAETTKATSDTNQ